MEKVALHEVMTQGKDHWWYRVRRELVVYLVRRYARGARSILDVGCASGDTLAVLSDRYEVAGVEISDEASELARTRGFTVTTATLPSIPHPDASFDVVLMLDVLEHLEDDRGALREVYRVLKPGGVFITFVPAYMFLWSVTDVLSHHFRRYTKGALVRSLATSGFTVRRSSYFNTFLFPAIALVRLVVRLFHIPMKSEMSEGLSAFNGVLYALFHIEYLVLHILNFPFGVSIFTVSVKKGSDL